MGGCLGSPRDGSSPNGDSSDVSIGRNQPLNPDKPKWKSDVPLTEGQLRSKRDEFWDTAPAFEGRKEIWDALKEAAYQLEAGDYALAQAIVDGANISLPNGSVMDCYDELGNRYQLPVYVLSVPTNLIEENSEQSDNGLSDDVPPSSPGVDLVVRFRLSTGKDLKLTVNSTDSVLKVKRHIHSLEGVESTAQRWFFSGKLLSDRMRIKDVKIPKGFVVQVIVAEPPPPAEPLGGTSSVIS
ncbi:hypothetical protein NP493_1283g00026 [Ridgeia piscesae]|uniref:Ubiquitin-like domain-containing protein n=1 Tax=Ridgeia piscesae TaxID=27915 RepID=A0AAD9K8Y4_RIDPI|nr:hypothetical protein NP493_1283g00026 [Ridgeia piscesae]